MELKNDIKIDSYLTFIMNNEQFAVSVRKVTELLEMLPITKVPKSAECMRGVINLRGAVVPVIDTRIKFLLPEVADTIDTCIIVMNVEMNDEIIKVGAIVDSVAEVIEVPEDQILSLPSIGRKERGQFIQGIIKSGSDFIMVLEVDKVFSNEELISLAQAENEIKVAKTA